MAALLIFLMPNVSSIKTNTNGDADIISELAKFQQEAFADFSSATVDRIVAVAQSNLMYIVSFFRKRATAFLARQPFPYLEIS